MRMWGAGGRGRKYRQGLQAGCPSTIAAALTSVNGLDQHTPWRQVLRTSQALAFRESARTCVE
jgi:hypothetical protein